MPWWLPPAIIVGAGAASAAYGWELLRRVMPIGGGDEVVVDAASGDRAEGHQGRVAAAVLGAFRGAVLVRDELARGDQAVDAAIVGCAGRHGRIDAGHS